MEKLELKHLAPYLPYSVRYIEVWRSSFRNQPDMLNNKIMIIQNINTLLCEKKRYLKSAKPILRPLSDLTKEIEVNGERFVPVEKLFPYGDKEENLADILENTEQVDYWIICKLFEWHFDVFGLIENGLAIDTNSI